MIDRLKDSLLKGGLSTENLDVSAPRDNTARFATEGKRANGLPQVLIYGSAIHETQPKQSFAREYPMGRCAASTPSFDHHQNHSINHELSTHCDDDDDDDDDDEDGLIDPQDSDGKDDCEESSRTTGSCAGTNDRRTVLIRNLPDRVTHKDLVENMRGGALLHIYLRAREHLASISFVEESDAQGFLQHAKNCGFYVVGRRVS